MPTRVGLDGFCVDPVLSFTYPFSPHSAYGMYDDTHPALVRYVPYMLCSTNELAMLSARFAVRDKYSSHYMAEDFTTLYCRLYNCWMWVLSHFAFAPNASLPTPRYFS